MKPSFTQMLLSIPTDAPPAPESSPLSSAESGANERWSLRCSTPRFTAIPSCAKGDLIPYLPRSPVTSAWMMRSVVVPVDVPVVYSELSCAGVTPPVEKIFHGTQGGPLMHVGFAAVPVACSALSTEARFI